MDPAVHTQKEALLQESLIKESVSIPVSYHMELPSTNDMAMTSAEAVKGLSMVVTDYQTKGKGQAGRTWDSEQGQNLLFSLLFNPATPLNLPQDVVETFTLDVVRSIAKTLGGLLAGTFDLKPPNDLFLNGKKVCGILSEVSREGLLVHRLVVGIGLNVNQRQFPEHLRHPATSLALETGCTWNRERLLGHLVEGLVPCFDTLENK